MGLFQMEPIMGLFMGLFMGPIKDCSWYISLDSSWDCSWVEDVLHDLLVRAVLLDPLEEPVLLALTQHFSPAAGSA